jgi:hypothetical protein
LRGIQIFCVSVTFGSTKPGNVSPSRSGWRQTIRITAIHVHYDLAVHAEAREATERALEIHPQGCPAHQSVKDAITITWSATVRAGEQVLTLHEDESPERSAKGPKADTMCRNDTR